jgi:hypothetical protein
MEVLVLFVFKFALGFGLGNWSISLLPSLTPRLCTPKQEENPLPPLDPCLSFSEARVQGMGEADCMAEHSVQP